MTDFEATQFMDDSKATFGLERLRKCPTIMSFIRASLAYVSGTYFAIRDEFVLVACLLWFVNI